MLADSAFVSALRPANRRGPPGPRPARSFAPAARGCAGRCRTDPWSAFSTPTSVTRGKSWPFVSICVPIRISVAPLSTSPSTAASVPLRLVASRSRRATRALGKSASSSSPTRCVPAPTAIRSLPQVRQAQRACARCAAVMAAQLARLFACTVIRASQRAHSSTLLHCGQNNAGAKPRRFKNSSTWLPAARCRSIARDERRGERLALACRFKIEDAHLRLTGRADAPRHVELAVAAWPLRCGSSRAMAWRTRARRARRALRAHDGQVACRIAKAASAACTKDRAPRRR